MDELNSLVNLIQVAQREKKKQITLEMEMKELRERLAIVEQTLGGQKQTLSDLFPKISTSHQKILKSRKKCTEVDQFCLKLGKLIRGTDYKCVQIVYNCRELVKSKTKILMFIVSSIISFPSILL